MVRGEYKMKIIVYIMLVMLSCNFPVFAITPNLSGLQSRVEKNVKAKTSATLNTVLDMEEANAYQRAQIEKLVTTLVKEVKPTNFKNNAEIVFYLNEKLPNFGDSDSVLLKNAFPTSEGEKPKENLDCDSRAILVKSILELMGYPFGKVWLATLPDHAVLTDGKQYYDLISGRIEVYANAELPLIHRIDTENQYKSLITANLATQARVDAGGGLLMQRANPEKVNEAIRLFKKAVELDSSNLNALMNLVRQIKWKEDISGYQKQIVEVMTLNYLVNTSQNPKVTDEAILNVMRLSPKVREEMMDLSFVDNKNVALWAVELLVKVGENPGGWFSFVAAKINFEQGNYEAMRKNLDVAYSLLGKEDHMRKQFEIAQLGREMELLKRIITGEIPATDNEKLKQLVQESKVMQMILNGDQIPMMYMDLGDFMARWKGCRSFMNRVSNEAFSNKLEDFCE